MTLKISTALLRKFYNDEFSEIMFNNNSQNYYNSINKCIGDDTKSPRSLAKAQTALGKQEIRSVFCRDSVQAAKTASPRKISLKSDNRLLSYGQTRFSIWRPSAIENFNKNLAIANR